jgi:hypothetical protein
VGDFIAAIGVYTEEVCDQRDENGDAIGEEKICAMIGVEINRLGSINGGIY